LERGEGNSIDRGKGKIGRAEAWAFGVPPRNKTVRRLLRGRDRYSLKKEYSFRKRIA